MNAIIKNMSENQVNLKLLEAVMDIREKIGEHGQLLVSIKAETGKTNGRVTKLESQMEGVQSDVASVKGKSNDIRDTVNRSDGKINRLLTRENLIIFVGALALIIAEVIRQLS